MYGIVYVALNVINNKVYVGQTVQNLIKRKTRHYRQSKTNIGTNYFHNALRKYEEWEWNILQFAYCKAELDALEKYWIWIFNSIAPGGYNTKEGGSNGKPTKETCKKMSLAKKGKKFTEEHCRNIGKGHEGIKYTEESKQKMSESQRGIIFTKERRKNISKGAMGNTNGRGNKGNMISKETKRKMSEAMKGKYLGAKSPRAKTIVCVETEEIYETISKANEEIGVDIGNISKVLNGKRKTAGGFHWIFYKLSHLGI